MMITMESSIYLFLSLYHTINPSLTPLQLPATTRAQKVVDQGTDQQTLCFLDRGRVSGVVVLRGDGE